MGYVGFIHYLFRFLSSNLLLQLKTKYTYMSIDIGKIIQVYEGCLTLLRAKQNLSIDSQQLNALFQNPVITNVQHRNFCVSFIEDGILRILRTWEKKFSLYDNLQDEHKHSYSQLQYKMDNLKNNSQIVTREDQLTAEIQQMMASWRQNMNPTQYYNSKSRKLFKAQMEQKLQSLRHCSNKNFNVTAPLYTSRVEKEFKENVIATYYQQTKIDKMLVDTTVSIHDELATVFGQLDDQTILKLEQKQVSTQSNLFLRDIHDILSRTSRPSDRRLKIYAESLSQTINKSYLFWSNLRKGLDHLIILLNEVFKALAKVKSNFEQKQQKIYRMLRDVPKSIANIFRVSIIYNLIKSFNSSCEASRILLDFKNKIVKRKQFAMRNENQCINYSNQVVNEAQLRYHNFQHFALVDRKFFEDQTKAEKVITKLITQNFKQFLQQCYNLTKMTRKVFTDHCRIQQFSSQQLDNYLSQLIINDMDDLSCRQQSTIEPESERSMLKSKDKEIQEGKKSQRAKKFAKIQQFINSIETFKSDVISEDEKFFSCALGPKILLHGKLFLLPEGIFFESHFNNKNLLFGKTKLFIPKSDIVEIDMKNTLVVFPDAVLVKTEHGLVSFHALGHRKIISAAIKEAYMGDSSNNQQGDGVATSALNFKPIEQGKMPTQVQIQDKCKNLQTLIYETVLKGSSLGNIFKKYFSDEKFKINGKQYENFKSYSLTLIDAKNPKSSTLTPSPPIYFTLKNQKDPQNPYPVTSSREHNYGKDLPKIPFLSKGGEGQCSQKETYTWLGMNALVINVVSTVKGFSLTEGMEVLIRYIFKQMQDGTKVTVSMQIKFAKQSSSNGLVKGPTITNVKQSMGKIFGTIQKCQRASKASTNKATNSEEATDIPTVQSLDQAGQLSSGSQVQLSKQQLIYIAIGFAIFYIITIVLVKSF